MTLKIYRNILLVLMVFLFTGVGSAEPVGEFSRTIDINGQSVTWQEEFELKRNFSKGFVVSYEPWTSPNYSGTLTDYSLSVNGEQIDAEDYVRSTYSEKRINLTKKGESWERNMTYPGYVECYAEGIKYSPIDSFPFKVCNLWTENPPLPAMEWTTTVYLPEEYDIKEETSFSYRNFTLDPLIDEYRANNTTKEFVWCDIRKGEIKTQEAQKGTLGNAETRYIFGPYKFSQSFSYANYTDCDAVKTGTVKTGSMLIFSYTPNSMYKSVFVASILMMTALIFLSRQTGFDRDYESVMTIFIAQQTLAFSIGSRPLHPTLYDLTILLIFIPMYWDWKSRNENSNFADES